MNVPGKFLVIYGINNLGKTTQAKLLVDHLNKAGVKAEYLKYPIYDLEPSGKLINDYLRKDNPENLSPREAQIIYTLNRTQFQNQLLEKLKTGTTIVAEDYTGTGLAWGMGAGVDEGFLKYLNSHLKVEDMAFLFEGERFKDAAEDNHKHELDEELLEKVKQAHEKLGKEFGWIKINANLSIDEIHGIIWLQVKNILNL